MAARFDASRAGPRDIGRLTAKAILAGDYEIVADGTTRDVKPQLSATGTHAAGAASSPSGMSQVDGAVAQDARAAVLVDHCSLHSVSLSGLSDQMPAPEVLAGWVQPIILTSSMARPRVARRRSRVSPAG